MMEQIQQQLAGLQGNQSGQVNQQVNTLQINNSVGNDPVAMLNEILQRLRSEESDGGYQVPEYISGSYAA